MKKVMCDLETLDNVPGGVILSIGAVEFDHVTGLLGKRFYEVVSIKSCQLMGLTVNPETVSWWRAQPQEAQAVLDLALAPDAVPLDTALGMFSEFLLSCDKEPELYGNGSDFDNAFLSVAYRKCGRPPPWKFWHNRCFRSLKSNKHLRKLVSEPLRQGAHHNALDDAVHQAHWAVALLRAEDQMAGDATAFREMVAGHARTDVPLFDAERGAGMRQAPVQRDKELVATHASHNSDGSVSLGGFIKSDGRNRLAEPKPWTDGKSPAVMDGVVQTWRDGEAGPGTEPLSKACMKAPAGWHCTRDTGHEGPCADEPNLPLYFDANTLEGDK